VNADDLGWTSGVNRAIVEAHRNGIVTSTTVLANGLAFEDGMQVARATPGLGVGVHLNLTNGRPILPSNRVTTLVDARGEFSGTTPQLLFRMASGKLALAEVEQEWDAQIRRVRDAGIEPTHLDGHKHVHMLPKFFPIAVRLAKKHGIASVRIAHESSTLRAALASGQSHNSGAVLKQGAQARGLKLLAPDARELAEGAGIDVADYFCGIAQTGELTQQGLQKLLSVLPEGITELMCHPGYADEELAKSGTRLQASREAELRILTDTEIRISVASLGIRLINYAQITNLV